jgi:hypothetical protein
MEPKNEFQIQLFFQIGYCNFILNLILWHLRNEGFVFSHNPLAWRQHGNLVGFNILQDFVTFGLQDSCKLLQLKHFLWDFLQNKKWRDCNKSSKWCIMDKKKRFEWSNLYAIMHYHQIRSQFLFHLHWHISFTSNKHRPTICSNGNYFFPISASISPPWINKVYNITL